ncbi:MAG: hypothetical protein KGD68_05740 [Candidatus Lokiarchaeota archaeon]|nr:hypothetical protein [Candidatus Lokiarchaeota archaeon]
MVGNKRLGLALGILLFFTVTILGAPITKAFWGYGDCGDGHPITTMKALYDKNAEIDLDGIPSESFWADPNNINGSYTVPLASEFNTSSFFVVYMNLTFVINDEYLYVLCKWFDNSTRPSLGGNNYDGLYFCWNINVPNFSAYFIDGMVTQPMGGGDVDNWDWTCLSASPPNGSSYYCRDMCFGTTGWYDPNLEIDHVKIGYSFIENKSYTLELQRKLVTNDPYDVQFNEKKLYKFNMGLMNDSTHEDHAISWTFALDLTEDEDQNQIDGFFVPILFSITFIAVIVIIRKKKLIHNH